MDLRPKSWFQRLNAGEFVLEFGIAIASAGTALVNGLKSLKSDPPDRDTALAFFGVAGAIAGLLILRAIRKNRDSQNTKELHAIDGVLHTLHAILTEPPSARIEGHKLRICLFVPGTQPNTVHQISAYVGDDAGRGLGRELSDRCGAVGVAFRSGQSLYDTLPKHTQLVDHLVAKHGFDRNEAITMKHDRKSWAAVPVGDLGRVVAVIYLDSAVAGFFGKSNEAKRKALEAATIGIANFIDRS